MNGGAYGKIIELNEELSIAMFDDTRGYWLALLRLVFVASFLDVFVGCFLVSWFQIFTSVLIFPTGQLKRAFQNHRCAREASTGPAGPY